MKSENLIIIRKHNVLISAIKNSMADHKKEQDFKAKSERLKSPKEL
jgi:hypothetical protein